MLLLFGPKDIFAHSCVYVADEIVYTKNGNGRLAPWVLMKYADVARIYSNVTPLPRPAPSGRCGSTLRA